jgi:hypothetical protein
MPVSTSLAAVDEFNSIQEDELAEFIKSLTAEEAEWLWLTMVQRNPRLAD